MRDDREELQRFRASPTELGQAAGKGSAKGKSTDKGGAEICYSWAQGKDLALTFTLAASAKGR